MAKQDHTNNFGFTVDTRQRLIALNDAMTNLAAAVDRHREKFQAGPEAYAGRPLEYSAAVSEICKLAILADLHRRFVADMGEPR